MRDARLIFDSYESLLGFGPLLPRMLSSLLSGEMSSKPLIDPRQLGYDQDGEWVVSSPLLQVLHATQQVNVACRVLLDHVFDIVWPESLAELPPGDKVFDLAQGTYSIFVLLGQNGVLDFPVIGLVVVYDVRDTCSWNGGKTNNGLGPLCVCVSMTVKCT